MNVCLQLLVVEMAICDESSQPGSTCETAERLNFLP